MKLRSMIVFFSALLLAILAVFLFNTMLKKKDAPGAEAEQKVMVMMASATLEPGTILDVGKMQWSEVGAKSVAPDMITKKKLVQTQGIDGGVVKQAIKEGEPVKLTQLILTDGKSELAAMIHAGMRAVTVPIVKIANAPSLIAPGDVVDVVIPKRAKDQGDSYFGQTIIRGVRVLAVDGALQKIDAKKGEAPKAITLEVNALQAEDLAGSIRDGQIVISLRGVFTSGEMPISEPVKTTAASDVADTKPPQTISVFRGSEKTEISVNK